MKRHIIKSGNVYAIRDCDMYLVLRYEGGGVLSILGEYTPEATDEFDPYIVAGTYDELVESINKHAID